MVRTSTASVRRRLIASMAAACVLFAGCGFQEQKEREDFLTKSGERAARLKGTKFNLTLSWKRKKLRETAARPIVLPQTAKFNGSLDFTHHRASVFAEGLTTPSTIFDDTEIFAKRLRAGSGAADPRPWATINLGKRQTEALDPKAALGYSWINPDYLVLLVGGLLPGSRKELGAETINGIPTTHYTANFDREKATRRTMKEDRVRALTQAMQVSGTRAASYPGEVWVDANGIVRRFAVTLEERLDVENIFFFTIAIDLLELGTPVQVAVPAKSEAKKVKNFVILTVEFDLPTGYNPNA
jgi:hypothetical protein